MIDFKLSIKKSVTAVWVTYKIYQGAVTTENEEDANGNLVPVTRYRRTAKLGERIRSFPANVSDATIQHEGTVEALVLAPAETLIPEQASL